MATMWVGSPTAIADISTILLDDTLGLPPSGGSFLRLRLAVLSQGHLADVGGGLWLSSIECALRGFNGEV